MTAAKPKIGSDPEYFVVDKGTAKITHAIGSVGGSKDHPRRLIENDTFIGAVQEDNVLVELNTVPCMDVDAFCRSFSTLLRSTSELLNRNHLAICSTPSYQYSNDELNQLPETAFIFGCDPDFNTYTGHINPKPRLSTEMQGFRCAGGHVHIGWDHVIPVERITQLTVGKMCDITLGLWGVVHQDDPKRKQLYGKAGCIRFKDYGIEYRTLGNFWTLTPETIRSVYYRATAAFEDRGSLPEIYEKYPAKLIQHTINHSDEAMAKKILEDLDYE